VIGIMSAYCGALERFDIENGSALPAFHSADHNFMLEALKFRVFGDTAMAIICLLSPAFSLVSYFHSFYPDLSVRWIAPLIVSLFLTSINVSALLLNKDQRAVSYQSQYDRHTKTFHYNDATQNVVLRSLLITIRAIAYFVCLVWVWKLVITATDVLLRNDKSGRTKILEISENGTG
jgi:hypothetical protein